MRKKILMVSILILVLGGCREYRDDPACSQYEYMSFEKLRASVAIEEPREIDKAGKIYIYGDTLLVNEKNRGVHVIDNSDKSNPISKAFIKIYGNVDIAVKDGYMYVDSFMDLLVFDINNIEEIKETSRKEDIFAYDRYQMFDFYDEYQLESCGFDLEKGVLIGVNNETE
ncbi:hypothetical protein GSY74_06300 [Sulfurovum sp. bin170]|uniref:hypothetical protein n=1 Tax=Sulfurovum sp. bin170 TaxID=2695268 RepID=UPI0013E0A3F9|nr:hypothetical protein [Sulfurovum sp. bin170]NEW60890.1 hypothetical protein [Sulfurovum sp. bin170]